MRPSVWRALWVILATASLGASCNSIVGNDDPHGLAPIDILVDAGIDSAPAATGGAGAGGSGGAIGPGGGGSGGAAPSGDGGAGGGGGGSGGAAAPGDAGVDAQGPTCMQAGATQCAGAVVQTCNSAGQWVSGTTCVNGCSAGACNACSSGTTQSQACGNCGTQTRTCVNGAWGAYGACGGQGVCAPGAVGSQACGNCGTQSRTCSSSCQWPTSFGTCSGQGVCAPGAVTSQACGNCGTQSRTCSSSCQWPAFGACGGQGTCAPGSTTTCSPGIPSCSGVATCQSNCSYGSCQATGCTPFVVAQNGDNNGPYGCGPQVFSSQTCPFTIAASCPAGTTRSSCVVADVGGRGSCTFTGYASSDASNPSCNFQASVGASEGTHCAVTVYCVGP
jgi:hypothetical protein